jgi:hypothetical protein
MSASDDVIRRTAKLWLEQHGDKALNKARDIVVGLQAVGDVGAADEWLRIILAIEELRQRPAEPR